MIFHIYIIYNQAYFNLVVESDIEYPYSFDPTEKIGKALLTGIPFVVYSTPNFLQNLWAKKDCHITL
mgnify:CR=1 FL=1